MQIHSPWDFLERLVSIPSFSGREREAAGYLVGQMLALGFRHAYIDAAGSPVGIWGCDAIPTTPYLLLLGHIDTVRGDILVRREERETSEADFLVGRDTVLHGRGSVDAKGPLATFVQAVSRLPQDTSIPIVVVGAVEEEISSSKGARQIAIDFPEPLAVVIGEPSHTRGVTLGYKGRLVVEFLAHRTMTHGAHKHESAAEIAFRIHQAVLNLQVQLNEGKSGAFTPLDYTIQSLNTSTDGLSEDVKFVLGFRLGPDFTPQALEQRLRNTISEELQEVEYELHVSGAESPAQYDKKSLLVRVFRNAIRAKGLEPRLLLKTGTSDMNVLASSWRCPMVAYGPGDSSLDHTPEERISLREYDLAISILSDTLATLVKELPR